MIHITGCEHIVTGGGGWQRHVRLGTAAVGSVYPPSFTHPRGERTKSIHTARSKHLLLDLDFFFWSEGRHSALVLVLYVILWVHSQGKGLMMAEVQEI